MVATLDVYSVFEECLTSDSVPVAAIRTLISLISQSQCSTMMGLEIELRAAADELYKKGQDKDLRSLYSLSAVCALFLKFITRTYEELGLSSRDFADVRTILAQRGEDFAQRSLQSRDKIGAFGRNFIPDGATVLLHGYSRVVASLLIDALQHRKQFNVVVTEGRPGHSGEDVSKALKPYGIPVKLIHDSAVGFIMEKIDLVLVGAVAVVENGGFINKIGSYNIALIAKAHKIPFYVASESYKFTRLFPITQQEILTLQEQQSSKNNTITLNKEEIVFSNPSSDFTPPELITLLFTDLGVLTPSAVSDELIKLYQ